MANLGQSTVCAVWNDLAKVQLWDVSNPLKELFDTEGGSSSTKFPNERPLFSCITHRDEGYGLAWSNLETGVYNEDLREDFIL